MSDLDNLKDLGVPDGPIEDLKEQDRKMSNAWQGRPQTKRQREKVHGRGREQRAAKLFALQPFSKMSDEEVLRRAGYSEHKVARAKSVVKSLSNSEAFTSALARHGIGPTMIAEIVAKGLEAKVPLRTKYNEVLLDKETGEPIMVVDEALRLSYLDRAIKVTGAEFVPAKAEVAQANPIFIAIMQKIQNMPPERREKVANGDLSAIEAEFTVENTQKDDE